MDLTGENTIITGGAGDIGRHVAEALLEGGARIGLLDANADRLRTAKEWLGSPDRVATVAVDLTDPVTTDRAFEELLATMGPASILVNAVGVGQFSSFMDVSAEEWDRVIDINLNSPIRCARMVLPQMLEAGKGTIVNICSIWSSRGGPNRSAYIASKHGLLGATRALAEEYRDRGIYVVSVSPGPVVTEMTRTWATAEELAAWMKPSEIAQVVVFTAAQAASLIGSDVQAFGRGRPAGL